MEIEHYYILKSSDMFDLIDRVNERIVGGYIPLGGVSVSVTKTPYVFIEYYSQAIVKYKVVEQGK